MLSKCLSFLQVRIWSVERSQKEIIDNMRLVDGVAGQSGLVAYWKFDDPNMLALMSCPTAAHRLTYKHISDA